MTRPHTAMLLSNPYTPDVRVEKEAHTLAAAGWRVSVIAWDRECRYPRQSVETAPPPLAAALAAWSGRAPGAPGPVVITRIPVPAGYRTGRQLLRRIPGFYAGTWAELRRARPDVVHAHDLDTLPLAMLYAAAARVPVIFDAHEYFPGMVRDNVGQAVFHALDLLDRFLVPRATAVIASSERLLARYHAAHRLELVLNAQPLPDRAALDAAGRAFRTRIGVPEEALLVVYVGYLNPDRLLAPLLEAVPQIPDVWLVVGGTGPNYQQVQDAADRCPRIRPLGWVPLSQVPEVVAGGDVVYYGLSRANLNSAFMMPNLVFFALAAGRPLLVTPGGEPAALVHREGCGLVLQAPTTPAVIAALEQLCGSALGATLQGCAARIGAAQYHWIGAADRLLAAYRDLPACVVRNVNKCQ